MVGRFHLPMMCRCTQHLQHSQIMVDRAKANPTITLMTNTVVTSITGTSSPTQNTGAPIAIPDRKSVV